MRERDTRKYKEKESKRDRGTERQLVWKRRPRKNRKKWPHELITQ